MTPRCHAKANGENTPERYKPLKAWSRADRKRCPYCSGERTGKPPCYISACDRGPNRSTCGCHWLMSGMGNPGPEGRLLPRYAGRRVA